MTVTTFALTIYHPLDLSAVVHELVPDSGNDWWKRCVFEAAAAVSWRLSPQVVDC